MAAAIFQAPGCPSVGACRDRNLEASSSNMRMCFLDVVSTARALIVDATNIRSAACVRTAVVAAPIITALAHYLFKALLLLHRGPSLYQIGIPGPLIRIAARCMLRILTIAFPIPALFIGTYIALPLAVIGSREIQSVTVPGKWHHDFVPACDEGRLSNLFLNEVRIAGLTAMNASSRPHSQAAHYWSRMSKCHRQLGEQSRGPGREQNTKHGRLMYAGLDKTSKTSPFHFQTRARARTTTIAFAGFYISCFLGMTGFRADLGGSSYHPSVDGILHM